MVLCWIVSFRWSFIWCSLGLGFGISSDSFLIQVSPQKVSFHIAKQWVKIFNCKIALSKSWLCQSWRYWPKLIGFGKTEKGIFWPNTCLLYNRTLWLYSLNIALLDSPEMDAHRYRSCITDIRISTLCSINVKRSLYVRIWSENRWRLRGDQNG